MKKLLLATLFVLPIASQAQSTEGADALNDKYGFQQATFESPLSSFTGLTFIKNDGSLKVYRTAKPAKIGEFITKPPEYAFFQGKLAEIRVDIKDSVSADGILYALVYAYGAPAERSGLDLFVWNTTRVRLNYIKGSTGLANMTMYSFPLLIARTAAEKQQKVQRIENARSQQLKQAVKAASAL